MRKIRIVLNKIAAAGLAVMMLSTQIPLPSFASEYQEPVADSEEALPDEELLDKELTDKEMPDEEMSDKEIPDEGLSDEDSSESGEEKSTVSNNSGDNQDSVGENETEYPAFEDEKKADGVKITVTAEEGVFPEGSELSVQRADDTEEEKALEAIEDKRENAQNVAASYTFDIKVLDKDGNEIEPADQNEVKVAFTLDEVADENLTTNIYHIKENGEFSEEISGSESISKNSSKSYSDEEDSIEKQTDEYDEELSSGLTAEKLDVETDGATATAETDGFSLYTVEFTYNELQYVLPGDSEAALSEILDKVGLSGDVTEVQVSDSTLFSAAKYRLSEDGKSPEKDEDDNPIEDEEGEWFITANQAFSSTEWMKVMINGVEYEITVTDVQTGTLLGNATDGYYVNMPVSNTSATINLQTLLDNGVTSLKVYDDGGKDGNYKYNASGYIILQAPVGYKLRMSGTVWTENSPKQDYLEVVNGDSYDFHNSIFKVYSTENGKATDFGPYTGSGENVTIYFYSYTDPYYAGFEMTVELIDTTTNYAITCAEVTGGTITTKVGESAVTQTTLDQTVTVNATPETGYYLNGVTVSIDGNSMVVPVEGGDFMSNTATFTMPAAAVTVTPTFTTDKTSLYLNMPASDTWTRTIPDGITSFKLYDDGGADGNHYEKCNSKITLTAPENCMLQLTGMITANMSYLQVYDGTTFNSGSSTKLIGTGSTDYGVPTDIGNAGITSDRYMSIRFYAGQNAVSSAGLDLTVTVIDKTPHAINTIQADGGSIRASMSSGVVSEASPAETVTLTATPGSGYKLVGISVTDANGNPVTVSGWDGSFDDTATFKMPATAVTVTPTFTNNLTAEDGLFINMPKTGNVNLNAAALSGVSSFKVYDDGGANGVYSTGCNGTLTLVAADDSLIYLKGSIITGGSGWLTVYDSASTEGSKLIDKAEGERSIATSSTGENMTIAFKSSSNQATWYGIDLTVTLYGAGQSFQIRKADHITGGDIQITVDGSDATGAIPGKTVTVTASTDTGYVFNGITVTSGGSSVEAGGGWFADNKATFVMPIGDVTVTPIFDAGYAEISIPGNGTIPSGTPAVRIYGYEEYTSVWPRTLILTAPGNHVIRLTGSLFFSDRVASDRFAHLTVYDSDGAAKLADYYIGSLEYNSNTFYPNNATSTGQSIKIAMHTKDFKNTSKLIAVVGRRIAAATGLSHGSVALDKDFASDGETVTVTPTPDPGYRAASVSFNNGSVHAVTAVNGVYSFNMPIDAVSSTISVNAAFDPEDYNITYALNGGTLPEGTANPQSYNILSSNTLPTPTRANHIFKGWKVTTAGGNSFGGLLITPEGVNWTLREVLSNSDGSNTYALNGNYGNVTLTAQWKLKTEITPVVSITGWTYGDTANAPGVTSGNTGGGDVTYEYFINAACTTKTTAANSGAASLGGVPKNAGTFYVRANVAETPQYQSGTATAEFTIAQKPVTITSLSASNKEYDGKTSATPAGTAVIDGVLDADSSNVSVSAGSAAFDNANAGTGKTVTFKGYSLTGTAAGNYTLSAQPASVTAEITKRTITIKADDQSVELNGNIATGTDYVSLTSGTLAENQAISSVTVATANTRDAIGEYDNAITADNAVIKNGTTDVTGNYDITYAPGKLTVTKAKAKVTKAPKAKNLIYNGSEQVLIEGGTTSDGTIKYSLSSGSGYSENLPKGKDAGSYTVFYKVIGDSNHEDSDEKSVSVTIKKASVTVKADNKEKTYGESDPAEFTAKVTGLMGSGTVNYTVSRATGENAGTYDITPSGDAVQGNYSLSFEKGTFTIKAKTVSSPVIELSKDTYTYDGNAKEPEVTVKDGSAVIPAREYTVSYSNNVNAGSATVTVTDKNGGNYTVNGSKEFTISKAAHEEASTTGLVRYGKSNTLDLSALIEPGGKIGSPVKEENGVISETARVDDNTIEFTAENDEDIIGKTANITVPITESDNYQDYNVVVTITVVEKYTQEIFFAEPTVTLKNGESYTNTLSGAMTPVSFKSSDEAVASVDGTGKVTALSKGSSMITALAEETEDYFPAVAEYTVNVEDDTPDKVPVKNSGESYASSEDNFAPVTSSGKINKMVLDFSNVALSKADPSALSMTVINGSKFTTAAKVKDKNSVKTTGGVKAKVNKKTLIPKITCKKNGTATFIMEDGNTYTVTFRVEKPKAQKSAKNLSKGSTAVTKTIKDLFGTDIDAGELKVLKQQHSQAAVSDNALVVDPKNKDSIKVQYQYLNKKYKLTIKVK